MVFVTSSTMAGIVRQVRDYLFGPKHPIDYVDIVYGTSWGDEAKGKVTSYLARHGKYDYVCRFNGGNNAGHTVYFNGEEFKLHLVPSGVFYQTKCLIGTGCVVDIDAFFKEINDLNDRGITTHGVRISTNVHIITPAHRAESETRSVTGGYLSTGRGIAPCYRDKYARTGLTLKSLMLDKTPETQSDRNRLLPFIWDEDGSVTGHTDRLSGRVLCEGAQGFWLDIDHGNYGYNTSSHCLPQSCLGNLRIPPQLVRRIYGAGKVYETRAGHDPEFSTPELVRDADLKDLAEIGHEYGTTTGRPRKTDWLRLDHLIDVCKSTGTTDLILSKIDVIRNMGIYQCHYQGQLREFPTWETFQGFINKTLRESCPYLNRIIYSSNRETIPELRNDGNGRWR